MKIIEMTEAEWNAKGEALFGADRMKWKFVCPSCGYTATPADWKDAGATEGEVAFSCVGRHMEESGDFGKKPGPCNYAGGGLFKLNPVHITAGDQVHQMFDFASPEGT